ncbi:hypothetical protein ASG99_14140 [Bacillus sp. Soil768D1]|nr:hypothetical protein ASG99_14140 [Bacillus sp. Soil768D1]
MPRISHSYFSIEKMAGALEDPTSRTFGKVSIMLKNPGVSCPGFLDSFISNQLQKNIVNRKKRPNV